MDTIRTTPEQGADDCTFCAPWSCCCVHLGRRAAQAHDLDPLDAAFAALTPGHTAHQSPPVPLTDDEDRVLYAQTCPDTGQTLYGPVLGGGDTDEPSGHARTVAERLRTAAARLDELAAVAA